MKTVFKTNITLIITAILTGIIVSIVAQLFIISAKNIYFFLYTNPFEINLFKLKVNLLPMIACTLAAFLISIVIKLTRIQRWHGPADSIYAANQKGGILNIKTSLLSTLVSFFSISGGASVGIYGPLVHFGATVGVILRRLTFMPKIPHDIIIGSGVAAAISAGFGSPIAGIIFSHEVVLRHFSLKAITSVAICSFSANFIAKEMDLIPPFFDFNEINFNFIDTLPGLVIIGLASAMVALIFMHSLLTTTKLSKKKFLKPHLKPYIPAFFCGIVGIFFPEVLGLGVNTISNIITSPSIFSILVIMLFLKIFLTSMCIGFGMFGGVFSPSLFLGALVGAIIFHLPFIDFDISVLSVFAIAGMAAVASSVIGAPITAIILVLELTGSYKYAITSILPICLSNLTTLIFFGSSFFDKQLLNRGINMSLGRENIAMTQVKIKNYKTLDYLAFNENETTKNIIKKFKKCNMTEGYFINKKGNLLGKVRLIDILGKEQNKGILLKQKSYIKLKGDDNLLNSIETLSHFVGETVPIVSETNILLGVVSEGDILRAYNVISKEIRSIEKN